MTSFTFRDKFIFLCSVILSFYLFLPISIYNIQSNKDFFRCWLHKPLNSFLLHSTNPLFPLIIDDILLNFFSELQFLYLFTKSFENKNINALSEYQQWFITSKLNGEQYLRENYPEQSLCILRPSNIYGYDCTPYYNNLLSFILNYCYKYAMPCHARPDHAMPCHGIASRLLS